MKLKKVQIKNFRSIDDDAINLDTTCRILVGINESGKSNILDALSLLDTDMSPVKNDDLREALPNESTIKESYVRFIFSFEKEESDKLFQEVLSNILTSSKNPKIVSYDKKEYTLKKFCTTNSQGLYIADILEEKKRFTCWSLNKYSLLDQWKKPTNTCPPDFEIDLKGEKYKLSQYQLIRASDIKDIPDNYLENADIKDFTSIVSDAITTITEENLPNTLFWEYDESNLLPNEIKIADFANNPDVCLPLKNMFSLAGIDNINDSIVEKRKGTDNQFQNYLNGIAKKTTTHFRDVWKEYKNIEFSLHLNADKIIPGIKEKNVVDFARRSDGFKRFVTFLLIISANVKTNDIQNTLILIDEPEIGLHPTGARYLRDELIKISKTNYVVYSTHSIFMIDSSDIARHYIVKKKDEKTSVEQAGASNIADEEVLFNALGHSIFDILKRKNIIFEGWNDKRLFQVAIAGSSLTLKNKYKDIGLCHAKGVKNINNITSMIELARRECIIISDSDIPAKEQQKLYQQDKGSGKWLNYQDINSNIECITGEDFLKNDFITRNINKVLGSSMPQFAQSDLPDKKNKIASIQNRLIQNGMTKEQAKEAMTKIKNSIFENLKFKDIEDSYKLLLNSIKL